MSEAATRMDVAVDWRSELAAGLSALLAAVICLRRRLKRTALALTFACIVLVRNAWRRKRTIETLGTNLLSIDHAIAEPSGVEQPPARVSRETREQTQRARALPIKPYAAFISHFKAEAAMEARHLHEKLEDALGRKCFLDSDDLSNLNVLKQNVLDSDVIVLVQSKGVLERPWCLIELVTALEHQIPIVGVSLQTGPFAYDFAAASAYLMALDTELEARNPGAPALLLEHGIDLESAAWKLSSTLPAIISTGFNASASKNVLAGTLSDVVSEIRKAAPLSIPSKDSFALKRQRIREALHDCTRSADPSADVLPHGSSVHHASERGVQPAAVPPEVPTLPESALARPDIVSALKSSVLRIGEDGANVTTLTAPAHAKKAFTHSNTTTAAGMGGVGKTMMAAMLVHDVEVRAAFEKICWVSVGQEPDTIALQRTLHRQLTNRPLPAVVQTDVLMALGELKAAAKDMSVLLVLDDVWIASHATPLNFVDGAALRSAVVATTRMASLLDGAAEVQCGVLTVEASLQLLLRTGGCERLVPHPPPAACEAVELCGRLPLALALAGGIVAALPDAWQEELVPLLKEEIGEASVEERVVTASLRIVPEATRAGVEGLFALYAVFAEDAIVPAAVIDLLAPLMASDAATKQAARRKMSVRKWLQQLLKANLLRGSMDAGVTVHDLVRDCMIRRAEAARDGGLRALQREAVPLLIAAFDVGGPAAGCSSQRTRILVFRRCAERPAFESLRRKTCR